jgi:hypothetical protein
MESTIADLAATLPLAEARMEVVLANLIEGGDITPNAITFHPRGLFARGYNRDILEAFWNKKTEKLELQVCREGMYDMLPKALFHPLKNTPTSELVEDKIATAQQTIQEEADARRFFLPFEQEFFRKRITVEREEQKLLAGFSNPVHHLLFTRFFGELNFLTLYQQEKLFYLFPLLSEIVGNMDLTSQSLSSLLGDPVAIIPSTDEAVTLECAGTARLSEVQLGLDWIIGGNITSAELPRITIVIGPVAAANLEKYMPGGNHAKLISCLADYLLPMELDYDVEVIPMSTAGLFTLSDLPQTSRLGFSTIVPPGQL